MAFPVKTALAVAKTAWKLGSWAVALIGELRHESKQKKLELERARRIQSERYQEASHTAGHEKGSK